MLSGAADARERLVYPDNARVAPIRVTVNGEQVDFSRAEPTMVSGRVLVPMRSVFNQLGVALVWDAPSRSVTARLGERTVVLPLNSTNALVNGQEVPLDVPARIHNGRTMVPLRFLAESLQASVRWIPASRIVQIVKGGSVEYVAQ